MKLGYNLFFQLRSIDYYKNLKDINKEVIDKTWAGIRAEIAATQDIEITNEVYFYLVKYAIR